MTRPSAAPERIAPSRFWRSGTACQPTMMSSSTACATRLAVERRDRAHERLGGAPRVEHVALADRAGADRGAQVVVAADRQHGAARLRQRVAGVAQRRAGEGGLGQQPGRRARPLDGLVPPAARVQVEPAGARGERQLGALLAAEPVHDPLADAQPAHAALRLGHVVAQPAVLRHRAQRARAQPGGRAEARGSPRRSGAPPPRRASRARRSRAPPARRRGRAGCRSPPSPTRRRRPRARRRTSASASARRRQRALHEPLGRDLGAGRHRRPDDRRLAVRDLLAVRGHDRRLARRRAQVEAEQQLRHGGT